MEERDIYLTGQQDFRNIRDNVALHVDKTQYIDNLVKYQSRYFFPARPRRFGKSLFLYTPKYFFEGKRKLFQDAHNRKLENRII